MVGTVVFWSLKGSVKREDLEKKLKAYSLDRWMPNVVTDKKAFVRTLKELEKDKIIVKIKDDSDELVYGVVTPNPDPENKDVDFTIDDVITLDKSTGTVALKIYNLDPSLVSKLMAHFKEIMTVDDLRALIKNVLEFECRAILLRKRGGVYLVPPDKREVCKKLKEIMEEFGSEIYMLDLVQNKDTMKDAKKITIEKLREEIDEEIKKLDEMKLKARTSTIAKSIKKYQMLIVKAETYQHIIQDELAKMKRKLSELQEKAKKILIERLA